MTRMFGDFEAWQGLSDGAAAEGYYETPDFTIMQALYYFSALAEGTPDLPETPINGIPGQVTLPFASNSTSAAWTIQQPRPPNAEFGHGEQAPVYGGQGGYQILDHYNEADCFQYHDVDQYKNLQFEPWIPENNLGPKTWIAKILPKGTKVVLKLWDAWKFDAEAQSREASVYLQLRPLWGKFIPSLRVKTVLEYFHALILEYVKVMPYLYSLMMRLLRFLRLP